MSKERRQLADSLRLAMIDWFAGDPKRIQHMLKVSSFAVAIGKGEGLNEHDLFILETVGYCHDIGIRVAEKTLGHSNGKLQEELGPGAAEEMLAGLGFEGPDIDRICLLIANHHTYDADIDGADFRILLEADACVNMYEDPKADDTARKAMLRNVFRTETGKHIYTSMFGFETE